MEIDEKRIISLARRLGQAKIHSSKILLVTHSIYLRLSMGQLNTLHVVGTASPNSKLEISGSSTANNLSLNVTDLLVVNQSAASINIVNANVSFTNTPASNASSMERWLDGNGRVVATRFWNGTALVLNVTG